METFNRICIKTATFKGGEHEARIERGKEYLTSAVDKNGNLTVFTSKWIHGVPAELFAGEQEFTKSKEEKMPNKTKCPADDCRGHLNVNEKGDLQCNVCNRMWIYITNKPKPQEDAD